MNVRPGVRWFSCCTSGIYNWNLAGMKRNNHILEVRFYFFYWFSLHNLELKFRLSGFRHIIPARGMLMTIGFLFILNLINFHSKGVLTCQFLNHGYRSVWWQSFPILKVNFPFIDLRKSVRYTTAMYTRLSFVLSCTIIWNVLNCWKWYS